MYYGVRPCRVTGVVTQDGHPLPGGPWQMSWLLVHHGISTTTTTPLPHCRQPGQVVLNPLLSKVQGAGSLLWFPTLGSAPSQM